MYFALECFEIFSLVLVLVSLGKISMVKIGKELISQYCDFS